jgi:hypothetical protein
LSRKFILKGFITAIILFVLNAVVYMVFLKDFFQNHPAVSPEFMKLLYRPDDQLVVWAMIVSSIAIGFLVTTVIYWSGARTFLTGLRSGFIFGLLFLCSVDLGLLATTNNFTIAGALADMICSTTTITISGAFAAWMQGRRLGH